MVKKTLYGKIKQLLIPILLVSFSANTHASIKTSDSFQANPPIHLKSNIPTLLPTGLTPVKVYTAYGFNHMPAQGEGQTIGIVVAYDNPQSESDLSTFNSQFGLPACTTANGCFKKIYASGVQPSQNYLWQLEAALDVQWAHAMAPKAKILLVEATDTGYSLLSAISVAVNNGASVISMSWGSQEFSSEIYYDYLFSNSNVTFVAASGDAGHGLLWPSVSPNVIAVGGTRLSTDGAGNYLSETAWSGGGGGVSAYESEPSYQLNFPIPNNPNSMRGVPDVSYNADPNTGFSIVVSGGWLTVGGTSAGAPQWAALAAVAKSYAGWSHWSLYNINQMLYTNTALYPKPAFYDITTGTNGSCGYYCTAQLGYDYVTGFGSPSVEYVVESLLPFKKSK